MKPPFDVWRNAVIAMTLALAGLAPPARAQGPAPAPAADLQTARQFLVGTLRDPNTTDMALASLRLTGDADLLALFVAYSSHTDKRVRLIALAGLADHKSEQATAAILERMRNDLVMGIRAQAIALLTQAKSATAAHLQEAMKCEDEGIQYLAARGLVSLGQGAAAADKLAKLVQSKDMVTSGLARLDLLTIGKADQLEPVLRLLTDPNSPPVFVGMMLERINED